LAAAAATAEPCSQMKVPPAKTRVTRYKSLFLVTRGIG
jgi:hypothetical protein